MQTDPRRVRRQELAERVSLLPKHKHWYLTHELAWILLRQFQPTLTVEATSPHFAHVNSAKCCMNNPQRRQAANRLFENCRGFIPAEIEILRPDIIVTQGRQGRLVMEAGFRPVRALGSSGCGGHVLECGGRQVLWLHTHHPSSYGRFWEQKRSCWASYAALVGAFIGNATETEAAPLLRPHSPAPQAALSELRPPARQASPNRREAMATSEVQGGVPRNIEQLIAAPRSVCSPETFERFVRHMHRSLPGPAHPHQGVFTGRRVQQFQNWQLDENPRLRLTDAQLLAVMRVEFPQAVGKVFTGDLATGLKIVAGIRADYNRTGHNGPTPASRGLPPAMRPCPTAGSEAGYRGGWSSHP
jgi:hypothetical protein